MANDNLNQAKLNKADEFYTSLFEIEEELKHYRSQFRDKIIFCNCDDPYESNFFKYFAINFNTLGLKKLIATCYNGSPVAYTQLSIFDLDEDTPKEDRIAYKVEITSVEDINGDGVIDLFDVEELLKTPGVVQKLNGNGDFRSDECIGLLKEADIVVTNPPFSLFREYVSALVSFNKKFLVIGTMNACHYKEIFPLIRANKLWVGYGFNKTMEFIMPDDYQMKGKAFIDNNGKKHGFVPAICWFTNLDVKKRHEDLTLFKKYDINEYPKYENLDCIEVSSVSDIPDDYYGLMGVPDTFLDKYNPEQFEIVGLGTEVPKTIIHKTAGNEIHFIDAKTDEIVYRVPYTVSERKAGNGLRLKVEGKPGPLPYSRIIIRRKKAQ